MAKNGKAPKSKGRKAKVQDKADAPEMRTAGELELKQVEIDDDDFDMHFRALKGAKERMAVGKNLYDGCCKAAKKVSPDLLDAVKRALKFEGMDAADIKRQLEIDGYVLKKTGSYVQLTIHDGLLGDATEQAGKRGFDDGKNGKPANSPYPQGTALARAYFSEWGRGQQDLLGIPDDGEDDAPDRTPARETELTH